MTYLPSKNPHSLEGGGTLSLSLENIKFDIYADIGHVFVSVTRLLSPSTNSVSVQYDGG